MKLVRILILEDDLLTQAVLLSHIATLEHEFLTSGKNVEIATTVLSEYTQVEEYINTLQSNHFDIILLDRDCKAGGSFHALNIEKIGADKIISISSTPPYNKEAKARGVSRSVHKTYDNLEEFSKKVIAHIRDMIG